MKTIFLLFMTSGGNWLMMEEMSKHFSLCTVRILAFDVLFSGHCAHLDTGSLANFLTDIFGPVALVLVLTV